MKWPAFSDRTVTALCLVCLTLVLSATGALTRIDHVLYDTAQQIYDRPVPDDVVLVTIDEQSLSDLGRWPWSRHTHAQLIDRLHAAGAKVIGLDVLFSEPQSNDPTADAQLSQAMARAGNVVLPVVIEQVRHNGQLVETLPLPILAQSVAALGRVHAELDADSIARSITLWEGLDRPIWPHFAQAMLSVAAQLPPAVATQPPPIQAMGAGQLVKHDQRYIRFFTGQRQLPSLSYAQVIRGEFSPDDLRDKLVLVGATASGMADSLSTPVSGFRQPMPGVEFLANAMLSLRSQTLITSAPGWLSTLIACTLACFPMLWLPFTSARTGLLATIAWLALVLLVATALPVWAGVWLPMTAAVAGMLCAYPLWSWRKLESASQFLDSELTRLQQELVNLQPVRPAGEPPVPNSHTDPFQNRIDQVRLATAQIKHLDQQQRDTLAFVTHDIRVPLASAAAQVKSALGEHHTVHKQLVRALAWTEDFLQTSRAQMLRAEAFAEMDLIAMLHELADDMAPLVSAQALTLELDVPAEPLWVWGHHDTLSRAMANLLSNAIKFSPAGGQIQLQAQHIGTQVHVSVTDPGPGIAAQDIERLFKRFSRLEPRAASLQTGVGLGLYFVQLTAQKHGGTVTVSSFPGKTTFKLSLPVL